MYNLAIESQAYTSSMPRIFVDPYPLIYYGNIILREVDLETLLLHAL